MTTVAAVARAGRVHMAADSRTNVYDRPVDSVRKVLRMSCGDFEFLLGVSGDGGLPGLLGAHWQLEDGPVSGEDMQPWAHKVAEAVTDLARTWGMVDEGRLNSNLILGAGGRLWTLSHAQAICHPDGIAAIGSGEGPAIGAIDALLARGVDPAKAVSEAVAIAIVRDPHSAGPIHTESL